MNKKILLTIIILFISSLITGCWNYIGLNEMTVVSGIAIDKVDEKYILNFEIYNLNESTDGEPIKSEIIESKGKTIFEAVRNAKKRVANKLYFVECKIIIISENIAKEDGLNSVIDWFTRDPEMRETLEIIISQEDTASEILKVNGLTSTIVSTDIQNIIQKDQSVTSTTESIPIYKVYNILKADGISLTLPAIHLIKNDDKKVCEANGVAIFKKDKLVGYLTSEQTKYYLLAKGKLDGGIITINTKLKSGDEDSQNISLEVKKSSSSQKYTSLEENNLEIKVSTMTKVNLGEFLYKEKKLSDEDLTVLEKEAGKIVSKRIKDVINIIQNKYNSDILGFCKVLYHNNPKIWKKIEDEFYKDFKNIKINVKSEFEIYNTGFTK